MLGSQLPAIPRLFFEVNGGTFAMKTVYVLVSLALALTAVASAAVQGTPQSCGTNVPGGTIAAGTYAGASPAGGTCEQAKQNAIHNGGTNPPTCAQCLAHPDECVASVSVPDQSHFNWGTCLYDPACNCEVVSLTVTQGTKWDKSCSSCSN